MEDHKGRPVRIRETSEEGDQEPHKHQVEPNWTDWDGQMCDWEVLRNPGGDPGIGRGQQTLAADSPGGLFKGDQGGGNPQGPEGRILGVSGEEQGGAPTGARDHGGSKSPTEGEERTGSREWFQKKKVAWEEWLAAREKRRKLEGDRWTPGGRSATLKRTLDEHEHEKEEEEPEKKRIRGEQEPEGVG